MVDLEEITKDIESILSSITYKSIVLDAMNRYNTINICSIGPHRYKISKKKLRTEAVVNYIKQLLISYRIRVNDNPEPRRARPNQGLGNREENRQENINDPH